jgi:acyl carrier protein
MINKNKKIKSLLIKTLNIKKNLKDTEIQLNKIPQWDSLNHVKVLNALEKKFKFKIDSSNFSQFTSYKKICNFLK